MAPAAGADRVALLGLRLATFRNYDRLDLEVDGASCVLTGPNGAGKTNLLEALSLLVPGRGLRRAALRELPQDGAGGGFAVHGRFATPDGIRHVGTAMGPGDERRTVHVDEAPCPGPAALAEVTAAVSLTPALDRLFQDGPSPRRRFLDRLTQAAIPSHARLLGRYEHLLRERSRLLREGPADAAWLAGLERQAAEAAVAIAAGRSEVTDLLNARLARQCSAFPAASLRVVGEVEERLATAPALPVEDWLAEALARSRAEDRESGGARHGVHRSDLEVVDVALDQPAARVSTGRQKALLVGLVLAESALVRERSGRWPLVLLDEVGAHLDRGRRNELVEELVATGAQLWLTATEPDGFERLRGMATFLRVDHAKVVVDGAQ